MNVLPDDIVRVLEDLCGAKELGVLGCTGKRWRPNEKTWERVAKRDPLTGCADVGAGHWSKWCAALGRLGITAASDHDVMPDLIDGYDIIPTFALQIWSGEALLAMKRLKLYEPARLDEEGYSRVSAGTFHLNEAHGVKCHYCQQMRAGKTVPDDSLGITLAFDDSAASLRFCIVALPRISSTGDCPFAPTVVFDLDVPVAVHRSFILNCQGTTADIMTNGHLRGPEDSSSYGLGHHHEDLVFYPIDHADNWIIGESRAHNCLEKLPACVVRIVCDAGGTATGLVIDEFKWEATSDSFNGLVVNRLPWNHRFGE